MTPLGFRFLVIAFLVCTPSHVLASSRSLKGPSQSKVSHIATWVLVSAAVLLVIGIIVAFPAALLVCIVQMLGFTAAGIKAGSWAACIMSLYAGKVAVGSICAICQRIGALGSLGVASIGVLLSFWPFIALATVILLLIIVGPAIGRAVASLWHSIIISPFFSRLFRSISKTWKGFRHGWTLAKSKLRATFSI